MNFLKLIIVIIILTYINIFAQNPPSDFKLTGTTGGVLPGESTESITILSSGKSEFIETRTNPLQILLDTVFNISTASVQKIWQSVSDNNFFSLHDSFKDDSITDGSVAVFTITANGNTKQVVVKNIIQQEIQNIITTINSNIPSNFNLNYLPPQKFNIVPTNPCDQSDGISPSLLRKVFPRKYKDKINSNYSSIAGTKDVIQIPHGGIEIGYQMSLFDAVRTGRAKLKSKGLYFGDGVSISGDNTKNFPPSDNTIHIKLNLEFFGHGDNSANESRIVKDIKDKWSGRTTSSGKKIEMDVTTLSHPEDNLPPGTPGFDDIKLEDGKGRSFCNGIGSSNSEQVVGGIWYPSDTRAGLFAHEVGHLMGLVDQYDDWHKQPDGNWKNSNNGTILSNPDFTNLYNTEYNFHLTTDYIKKNTLLGVPHSGHEGDLMADVSKPPLQSDIDNLAKKAGLIIVVKPGDILSNSNNSEQNLVVTHVGDLFLKPGGKKTLNGIYTACIDADKSAPDSGVVFNVAPSLDKWEGITAAQALLKVVRYVDSLKNYYCGNISFSGQDAVWRVTDNSVPSSNLTSDVLKNAGLNIEDQLFYFPRLTNNLSSDSISRAVIPNELFSPDIIPQSIKAAVGENLTFIAKISKPFGFNYSTDFSWQLSAPEGSLSHISSEGIFTPDKMGIYSVSLKINITDSNGTNNDYTPDLKSYVIVPNNFTETFEHQNLSDNFKWETYGDSKWQITDSDAETGSYSVRSGDVSQGQSTTLSINVNLPKDSSITFALKMFANSFGTLFFNVDGIFTDLWDYSLDWQFFTYKLSAGQHILTWELTNSNNTPAVVWLDNVFFPYNSVVTNVNQTEKVPETFSLYQNYPNPFNPTTIISFELPKRVHVTLKVYNLLGQKITTLVNGVRQAGNYHEVFNASSLPSGVYVYKITAGSFSSSKKMILIK